MFVKKRELLILQYFLNEHSQANIKQFSSMFNVSDRSIRYDLDSLNYFLKDTGLMLTLDNKSKINFILSEQDKNTLLTKLWELNISDIRLNNQEKLYFVIITLMNSTEPVTVTSLADQLAVSRTSLAGLIKKACVWFSEQGMELVINARKGLSLKYTENQWRKTAAQLLNNENNQFYFYIVMNGYNINTEKWPCSPINYIFPNYCIKLLEEKELYKVIDVVSEIEKALTVKFTDSSYISLLIHLSIIVKRLRQGKTIVLPGEKITQLKLNNEYLIFEKAVKNLEEIFAVQFPPQEIGYFAMHLQCAKKILENNQADIDLIETSMDVIAAVESQLQTSFNPMDVTGLANDLAVHLRSAIIRLKNEITITNQFLDTVLSDYYKIFQATKNACTIIKNRYHLSFFPDEEVAYIAMHICAALERNKLSKKSTFRAIIMCSTGTGTAKMLSSRLNVEFPDIAVVGETSFMDLGNMDNLKADIILSTLNVDAVSCIPIVRISPFLCNEDIKKIEAVLENKKTSSVYNYEQNVNNFPRFTGIIPREIFLLIKKQIGEKNPLKRADVSGYI